MEDREYTSSGFIERRHAGERRHVDPAPSLYDRIEERLQAIEDERRQTRGRRWTDKASSPDNSRARVN